MVNLKNQVRDCTVTSKLIVLLFDFYILAPLKFYDDFLFLHTQFCFAGSKASYRIIQIIITSVSLVYQWTMCGVI